MARDALKTAGEAILEGLGFSKPFLYAVGVYGFFHWLDRRASVPANKAIVEWLRPQMPSNEALANALLEIFDRVYSRPLLHWHAFLRSAIISICVAAFVLYELAPEMLLPRSYATNWIGCLTTIG